MKKTKSLYHGHRFPDALFIEHDGIPDVERSGILEPESTEAELTLANSMHQLDA